MPSKLRVIGVLCCVVSAVATAPAFAAPSVTFLGYLPGMTEPNFTWASDISGDGTIVVGTGIQANNAGRIGFRWTRESGYELLPSTTNLASGSTSSSATAMSADGSFAFGNDGALGFIGVEFPGVRWDANGLQSSLGPLEPGVTSQSSSVYDANVNGTIAVGEVRTSAGNQAFIWQEGVGRTALGRLPDDDVPGVSFSSVAMGVSDDGTRVVGWNWSRLYADPGPGSEDFRQAFLWTPENGMTPLDTPAGTLESFANEITRDGATVVGSIETASTTEAYIWRESVGMVSIGDVDGGAVNSSANAITPDGRVVVGYGTNDDGRVATIWDNHNGLRDLNLVMAGLGVDLQGLTLDTATGVSDDGRSIVGYALSASGAPQPFLVFIPEPGTGLLVGLGLLLAARSRSHRR